MKDLKKRLTHPSFWLVFGLPWPDSAAKATMAEAAFAFAPGTLSGRRVTKDVDDLAGFAEVYAKEHPDQRAVWFSDVTRWLDTKGHTWATLGVDWESALQDVVEAPILGLFMTVSRRAYAHLVDTAKVHVVHHADGRRERLTGEEREAVRKALERQLSNDWPRYVGEMVRSGRLTIR